MFLIFQDVVAKTGDFPSNLWHQTSQQKQAPLRHVSFFQDVVAKTGEGSNNSSVPSDPATKANHTETCFILSGFSC
jgi:hypothetical protein